MGRGCGRGGAQLGKAVKGKSKERKKDKKGVGGKAQTAAGEKQLSEDIRMLEEYERLNKLAEAQRNRLKVRRTSSSSSSGAAMGWRAACGAGKGERGRAGMHARSMSCHRNTARRARSSVALVVIAIACATVAVLPRCACQKLMHQETYNTRLNKKLLTNMYRAVMRLEKVDLLRKEIDVVAQNHQRDVDRKDDIIHMLKHDLEDGEEQSDNKHTATENKSRGRGERE